jgi:hypothetical protein
MSASCGQGARGAEQIVSIGFAASSSSLALFVSSGNSSERGDLGGEVGNRTGKVGQDTR